MSVERKTSSYRIDQAKDGRFYVIHTITGEPNSVVSRHLTRDAARGWLVSHLTDINMDRMTNWTPDHTP